MDARFTAMDSQITLQISEVKGLISTLNATVIDLVSDLVRFGMPAGLYKAVLNSSENVLGTVVAVAFQNNQWERMSVLNQSRWCNLSSATATGPGYSYTTGFISDIGAVITAQHGPVNFLGAGYYPSGTRLAFCLNGNEFDCMIVQSIRCASDQQSWRLSTDFCALYLEPHSHTHLRELPLSDLPFHKMSGLLAYGSGLQSVQNHWVRVSVQMRHDTVGDGLYHTGAQVYRGMSGGPFLALDGSVQGVLVSSSYPDNSVGIAAHINRTIALSLQSLVTGSQPVVGNLDWCAAKPQLAASGIFLTEGSIMGGPLAFPWSLGR